MPNQVITSAAGSSRAPTWAHIDDFSPGVYDATFIATESPVVSAPLGAANAESTFSCMALPGGGLGPLPALTLVTTYTPPFPGALTTFFLTGFTLNPALAANAPELVILMEGDDGTTHYVLDYSYVPAIATANVILSSNSTTTPGYFGSPYPVWTRMSPGGSQPWLPELVFPGAVLTDAHGNQGHVYIYPPVGAPSSFAVQDLVVPGTTGSGGQTIAYANRVLVLEGVNYTWPAGGGFNTNENVSFTDPPLSTTLGNQMIILSAEAPYGYGAWGSVSVGELLLVKKSGGAVALYGDIDAPSSVILLPGVESTGGFVGSALATQIGLIYCSQDRGAWLWNGGNTSQKISKQLRDAFYDATTPTAMGSNNYGFYVGRWQDWILFSNNYLYNAETGAWWVLYPNSSNGTSAVPGRTLFWYQQGNLGNQLFAAPLSMSTTGPRAREWFYKFDNTVPSSHYQWTSLPMHVVADATRVIDVVQVIVRASQPDAGTTSTVTVSVGGESHISTETIGPTPTPLRFNFGSASLGLNDIIVTINADNPSAAAAPLVHSIDIGYTTRALVPQQ